MEWRIANPKAVTGVLDKHSADRLILQALLSDSIACDTDSGVLVFSGTHFRFSVDAQVDGILRSYERLDQWLLPDFVF